MEITLVLEVDDPDIIDSEDSCGLTEEGNDRLYDALTNAGFALSSGPTRVPGSY